MESLATKMQQMEATITDMATKMNAYVNSVDGMMTTIENNDISVKGSLEAKMTELQTTMSKAIADAAGIQHGQLQVLRTEVGNNLVVMDGKLQAASDLITGAETACIGSEQVQEDLKNKMLAMEQEVIRMETVSSEFKKQVVSEVTKVKMGIEQGDDADNGKEKKEF